MRMAFYTWCMLHMNSSVDSGILTITGTIISLMSFVVFLVEFIVQFVGYIIALDS